MFSGWPSLWACWWVHCQLQWWCGCAINGQRIKGAPLWSWACRGSFSWAALVDVIMSTRVVKTKTTTWLRWRFARFVLNNMKRRTVGKRPSDKGLCYKLKAKNACYRMFFGVVMWYLDEAKRIWLQNDWSTRSMRKMRFLSICEYLWYQEKNILQWPFLDIIHSWALHFVVFLATRNSIL